MEKKMININALNKVFKIVFDNPHIQIKHETTADDIDEWDSLSHVLLISAIEGEFNIEFSQNEVMLFNCVGDMLDCVNKKIG